MRSYDEIYDDWKLQAVTIVIALVLLAIGNVLWIGIIQFEKFGGDPQKRSLANMLTSMASIACCIIQDNTVSMLLIRASLGTCLPSFLGLTTVFIRRWLSCMIAMFITGILIYKSLQVYKYYFVARLNDEFWARFLGIWTALASVTFISIWTFLVANENPFLDMLICQRHVYEAGISNK